MSKHNDIDFHRNESGAADGFSNIIEDLKKTDWEQLVKNSQSPIVASARALEYLNHCPLDITIYDYGVGEKILGGSSDSHQEPITEKELYMDLGASKSLKDNEKPLPVDADKSRETYELTPGSPGYNDLWRRYDENDVNDRKEREVNRPSEAPDKSRETFEMTPGSPAHRALLRRLSQPTDNDRNPASDEKGDNRIRRNNWS